MKSVIVYRRPLRATLMRLYIALAGLTIMSGCNREARTPVSQNETTDSSFAAVQQRGGMAMGVDQYASSHVFDTTPDGGRISLQSDTDDSLAIAQIRTHMRLIQHAFEAGDFSAPSFVHNRNMPGTDVMARKRNAIQYNYEELPRGGAIVLRTSDQEALSAISSFLDAQRTDHHSKGTH